MRGYRRCRSGDFADPMIRREVHVACGINGNVAREAYLCVCRETAIPAEAKISSHSTASNCDNRTRRTRHHPNSVVFAVCNVQIPHGVDSDATREVKLRICTGTSISAEASEASTPTWPDSC